jgi:hypothetical protein
MTRRDFVIAAAGTLLAAPAGRSLAETEGAPVVGFLAIAARPNHVSDIEAFRQGSSSSATSLARRS